MKLFVLRKGYTNWICASLLIQFSFIQPFSVLFSHIHSYSRSFKPIKNFLSLILRNRLNLNRFHVIQGGSFGVHESVFAFLVGWFLIESVYFLLTVIYFESETELI